MMMALTFDGEVGRARVAAKILDRAIQRR